MSDLRTIADTLLASCSVGIISHINPDADTLGSALALHHALKELGKGTVLYCQDAIPAHMAVMSDCMLFTQDAGALAACDVLIAVDCGDMGRLGEATMYCGSKPCFLNVDHHASNPHYGTENYVREQGATAEIVFAILVEMGVPMNPVIGLCLYAGIVTDTGRFAFGNTTPQTMRIAGDLLEAGTDFDAVNTAFYRTNRWEHTQLLGACLRTLVRYCTNRVALMVLNLETLAACHALPSDSEGLVNYAVDVEGVEIGLLMQEKAPGQWKLSFRSRGKYSVAGLAKYFGGGGHRNAAGGRAEGSETEVRNALLVAIEELLQ